MRISIKRSTFLLTFFCLIANIHAQTRHITFDRINLPGGAYGNYITSMVQDHQGYMWFGTWGGLHRYDGYQVTTFIHRPDDAISLANTWVECLYVDRDGDLWVGTYGGGLDRFDRDVEGFSHYRHDPADSSSLSQNVVTAILEDTSGVLWVGTHGGLNRFDRATGAFKHFNHDPSGTNSLSDDQVRAIYQDHQGTLWVGTGSPTDPPEGLGGLNRFDPISDTFVRYVHEPGDENSLIDSQVRALFDDSRGTFWIGTWGDGLHSMDRAAGTFSRFRYDQAHPDQLSRPHLSDDPGHGGVSFVYEDSGGLLWIGAAGGGLNSYDPTTGIVTHYEHDPDDLNSLTDNQVWTIYESRDGTLWIGTLGGLNKLDAAASQFPHYSLDDNETTNNARALFESQDGGLWVGTGGGLFKLNRETGVFTHYFTENSEGRHLMDDRVLALYEDHDGLLWTGSWGGGLNLYDQASGTLTHYELNPDTTGSLRNNTIRTIFEDRLGIIWIGTETGGLHRFVRESGRFVRYLHDPTDATSISQNAVHVLFEDRTGDLWIGTGGGLNHLDRETDSFTYYQYDPTGQGGLSDNVVLSIYEDQPGRLWIGTEAGGLNLFDRTTGTFTFFTSDNSGLPDNRILGILGDDLGNLWMSTGQGLTRYNPERNTFHSYGTDHGLPAEPFYHGSFHMSRQGEMFVGGRNGFHAFFPEYIRSEANPHLPQIALTGFMLFNQPVRYGPAAPLPKSISETKKIFLSYKQNDLSFNFAALHYSHPAKNQYAYFLEPYEDIWREVSYERKATYTNLDPGSYVFRVKASNSDGVWNEEGISVHLVIRPPFWASWWFRILALAMLFGLVFGGYRLRVRQIQSKNRMLEREVADRTRDLQHSLKLLTEAQDMLIHAEKMAALGQLTAGIAHEIKNPLNFVNNFALLSVDLVGELSETFEKNKNKRISEVKKNLDDILTDLISSTEKINEHGRRADSIIRNMLAHSQGSPGERTPTDLNALLEQYVELAYHGQRAQKADFNVQIDRDYDRTTGILSLRPQEIGRVFINLLNNAFDAVHHKVISTNDHYTPVVSISTRKKDNNVEIRVRDNGPGIPVEIRDKIFEPFFTTKPLGAGTGLGLSLSFDIITQAYGGTLTVESQEGDGSTFVITLPALV